MDLHMEGKVVVITGGSQGIGKAAALEFAKEGCQVCVCARREERLMETKAEFAEKGYDLYIRKVDVREQEQVEAFAQDVEERFGKIDVWINNAGANHFQMLLDYSVEEFQDMVNTNLTSVFIGGTAAARRMKKTGGGVILNCSSYAAISPYAGKAPYAACKSGVLSLTKTMAAEFAPYHIRVAAYIPGAIRTEISRPNFERMGDALLRDIPCRRAGEPEDLAKALVFLASDAADYINGVALEISGGKRCVQNPMYAWEQEEQEV